MEEINIFEIKFNENKDSYKPGDIISGKCIIELKNEIIIKALYITIEGTAMVCWTESNDNKCIIYKDSFLIISQYIELIHSEILDEKKLLEKGRQEIFFSSKIPLENLLDSFKGKFGSIKYVIKAHIINDINSKMFNKKNYKCSPDKFFKIHCPFNIKTPEFQIPIEDSIEKSICCLCCATGPISIMAKLNFKGYYPGEAIRIQADFENLSSHKMKPYATLYQLQTFIAIGDKKKLKQKISKYSDKAFARSKTTWIDKQLQIPVAIPSTINCSIIKMEYFVKIGLNLPGSKDVFVNLPIVIGNETSSNWSASPNTSSSSNQTLHFSNLAVSNKKIINPNNMNKKGVINKRPENTVFTIDTDERLCHYEVIRSLISEYSVPPPYEANMPSPPPAYVYENEGMHQDEIIDETVL